MYPKKPAGSHSTCPPVARCGSSPASPQLLAGEVHFPPWAPRRPPEGSGLEGSAGGQTHFPGQEVPLLLSWLLSAVARPGSGEEGRGSGAAVRARDGLCSLAPPAVPRRSAHRSLREVMGAPLFSAPWGLGVAAGTVMVGTEINVQTFFFFGSLFVGY